jgi:hypothetical protein
MIRTIAGNGWLRTALGSTTAAYSIQLQGDDPAAPGASAQGYLIADVSLMVEAQAAGRATLVLENGHSVAVRVMELAPDGLKVRIAEQLSFWPGYSR